MEKIIYIVVSIVGVIVAIYSATSPTLMTDEELWTELTSLLDEQSVDLTTLVSTQKSLMIQSENLEQKYQTLETKFTVLQTQSENLQIESKQSLNEMNELKTSFQNYVEEQKVERIKTIAISAAIGVATGIIINAIL